VDGGPDGLARPLRMGPLMRIPSPFKLLAGMWIAALLGAVAGRSLAEVSSVQLRGLLSPLPDKVGVR
jgi:hypothetical protein